MATIPTYTKVPLPTDQAAFTRPPTDAYQMGAPVGGGTSQAPVVLDPRGLVPVNRMQPVATDGGEAQRIMERRLGSMPPSSFAGAGAGFVPADRPTAMAAIANPAVQKTDFANYELATNQGTAPVPVLSAEANADMARQQLYDRTPALQAQPTLDQVRQRIAIQRAASAARMRQMMANRGQPTQAAPQAQPSMADKLRMALAGSPVPQGLLNQTKGV